MPELPEVEKAMHRLRKAVEGKTIASVRALHPALARQLPEEKALLVQQRQIVRVERRGKHQLLHLDDGRVVHVHFRMNGDWVIGVSSDPLPRFARASLPAGENDLTSSVCE